VSGAFTPATVRLILARDDNRCARCGRPVRVEDRGRGWSVQHRRPRGMGGSKDPVTASPVNAVILCGSATTLCHGWVETHRAEARTHGWLVPQWRDPADVPVLHHRQGWVWITPAGYRACTTAERWLLAGQWLADELRSSGIPDDDVDGVQRLSVAASDLFAVMAGDVRRTA